MTVDAFPWSAFIAFALINSLTPGPNVILLASSGGRWGLKKTLPHLLGVCLGFPVMLLLVQGASDQVFQRWPWVFSALTALSLVYVLWLAVRVFKMGLRPDGAAGSSTRPMTFFEAVLFQWVNGKAWQIALMTATLYATDRLVVRFGIAGSTGAITMAAGIAWIELGSRVARWLERPVLRKAYYSVFAAALLLSTWPTGVKLLWRAYAP